MFYDWRPYVSAAERRQHASRELARLKKTGRRTSPVMIEGRKIAKTFWGKAWCDNLERYSDFANRLPRGRTYVRNGSVIDLQIARGRRDRAGERLRHLHGRRQGRRLYPRRGGAPSARTALAPSIPSSSCSRAASRAG